MEQYPDPAKRRDRFLIQAAWADQTPAAELDVAERVTPTPPPLRPPALTLPPAAPQWRLLLQSAGKAGKGTAWAEFKLESVLTVPSLISESVILEDEDEGSTPGSTPAKGAHETHPFFLNRNHLFFPDFSLLN